MDDADRADLQIEREMEHLMALRAARDAMAPLEPADFCADCGDQIAALRRAALPRTTLCVYCAQAAEQRAAVYGGGS
jgi:RNA polymerase-binding transcription factor DksA